MMRQKIAILDAGSQHCKVIDRRVRELKVETDILPFNTPQETLKEYGGIIISGGPNSVYSENAPDYDEMIFNLARDFNIPILGICYGMQLINHHYGGMVANNGDGYDGQARVSIDTDCELFRNLESEETVLLTHGDSVQSVSMHLNVTSRFGGVITGIQHSIYPIYGVQFHPEVDLTPNGKTVFQNFLYEICEMEGTFVIGNMLEGMMNRISEEVGDKKVVVLVSGGVDSCVCCELLYKVLGKDRVHGIHIDTGFMRHNESLNVYEALRESGFELDVINCKEKFLNSTTTIDGVKTLALRKVTDPEIKRKIIGDTFMRVAEHEIRILGLGSHDFLLAQGTLRPDLIESASSMVSQTASTIKTHHNDTNLVREMRSKGLILEPLKDLHKDQVRELGRLLGLPDSMVNRHPFPGPGLAIRILCADEPYVKDFDEIYEELKEFEVEIEIEIKGNFKLHLLPIRTVGVQGDGRSYSYAVAIEDVKDKTNVDYDFLFELCRQIVKRFKSVNRVVYRIGGKRIESSTDFSIKSSFIPTLLSEEVCDELRIADTIVNNAVERCGCKVSQIPVVLLPLGNNRRRSVVVRPFVTNDFMTGRVPIPGVDVNISREFVTSVASELSKTMKYSHIFLDLTSKPPGTTEWE